MAQSQAERVRDVHLLKDRDERRVQDLDRLIAADAARQAEVATLRTENAVLKSRLDEQTKRFDTWAGRAWTLVTVLVGALLSLAAGLIVTLARK